MQVWRNWQTRMVQVHMNASSCRFKSCYLHQKDHCRMTVVFFQLIFCKAKYITNPTAHKDKILSLRAAGFYHLSPITAAVTALAKRLTASVMQASGISE